MSQNALVRDSSTGRFIAIVEDIILLMAQQERDFRSNPGKAIKRVRSRMIMDPNDDKLAMRASPDFRPAPGSNASGFTVYFDDGGNPYVDNCLTMGLRAEVSLPDSNGRLVETMVRPAFVCDGLSGFVPYVERVKAKDAKGEPGTDDYTPAEYTWTSTGQMPCIFFRSPAKKGKKAPPPVAVCLGFARPFLLDAWKTLVNHPDRQHAARKLFAIDWVPNNLRGASRHLVFTPRGNPYTPVWYGDSVDKLRAAIKQMNAGEKGVPTPNPDELILTHIFGKVVIPLSRNTEIPVIYDLPGGGSGCVPCVFRIQEQSGKVLVIYKGEKRNMGELTDQDMSLDKLEFNALTALGLTMETAITGKALRQLKDRLIRGVLSQNNPLYMQAVESSGLEPGHHDAQARGPMRFIGDAAVEEIEKQLKSERDIIAGKLTMPGFTDKPSLETILGELTSENLRSRAFQRKGECILATWIAKTANWDSFNFKSWLHREVRFRVIMDMARVADLKLPPKPEPKQETKPVEPVPEPDNGTAPAEGEGQQAKPDNGSSKATPPAEETAKQRKARLARKRRAAAKAAKEGSQPNA